MTNCLQLDVGNSRAKWRLVEHGQVLYRGCYSQEDQGSLEALLGCTETLSRILISSVASDARERQLAELLRTQWGVQPEFARTPARSGDLQNSYKDPSRMGVDRWLAMLGARQRSTNRLCVVDAGSALTIDLVSPLGQHEGGYIIPGPTLMERALLLDTDRVRFAEEVQYALSPGTSTAAAVRHGIAIAQVGSLAIALDQCGSQQPELIFCGGAGQLLMQLLGRGGAFCPDLIFEGLEIMCRPAIAG